jgi:hypothetical protein
LSAAVLLQVVIHQVAMDRHGHDSLYHVRCASVLADPAAILAAAVHGDDEAADQAHDQVQIPALHNGQKGMILKTPIDLQPIKHAWVNKDSSRCRLFSKCIHAA